MNRFIAIILTALLTVCAKAENDTSHGEGGIFFSHSTGEKSVMHDASDIYRWGAEAEGTYRLTENVVLSGAVSYTNTSGKGVTGSVFTESNDIHPFDIIISTPANTSQETINLAGSMDSRLWKGLHLLCSADYTTSNYSRHRDLRHVLSMMDLKTDIGVRYDFPGCSLGASFLYRRKSDDISFRTFGTTDIVHSAFVDYANGMGMEEAYTGSEILSNNEQPLFSDYFGLSANIKVPISKRLNASAGFSYSKRNGFYGKESQFSIIHFTHESDCYGINAEVAYKAQKSRHALQLDMNIENLTAFRSNYLEQKTNGVSSYSYFDAVKSANKVRAIGTIAYNADFSGWGISLGTAFDSRKQTGYLFPESLTTDYTLLTPFVGASHGFRMKDTSVLTAEACISMRSCSGDFISNYDMLTDDRVCGNMKLDYEFTVKHLRGARPHVSVAYNTLYKHISCKLGVRF